MRRALLLYVRAADRLADWTGWIAMMLIFVMMAVMLWDVVARKFLDIYIMWGLEFLQFTLAAYYFMGGAKTLKDNTHVRMDLFYDRLTVRGRAWMDLATVGCLIFYLAVLLWGSISSLQFSIDTNQRLPSVWRPSVVPIKALMTACIALMLAQSFALVIRHAHTALTGRDLFPREPA
ncbi:TRAP transporter small permease subunit [Rhodobaculum claviforme]|uniref:TRAP transporter small permease protein n=1 Tax=Rhodobaculum claviforme TaxID=1549854 RepID=A0A934WJL1_9RHOB|nr:TRAP transporter small permease subunit [Rhodobaculum claviforme]MBK5928052.1 C4-dicarboxylate ABC transporter permease [Rhodobaculum claviforme]